MTFTKSCSICGSFVTCHGTTCRYIRCKTCHPSEKSFCFDCHRSGLHCPGLDHKSYLTIRDLNTDEEYTESLDNTRDLLAVEAGCLEYVDPLVGLARPELMPKGWFKCIHIVPAQNEFELLECVLVHEEYPPNPRLGGLWVIHPPRPAPWEESHAILCNNELVEVPESLYRILNNILNATEAVSALQNEDGDRQSSIQRFWIAELCLDEALRSLPPIPLEAICALAGRLTNNHIFHEDLMPSGKLLQLVKFDRFGTPILHSRELQQEAKPIFQFCRLPKDQTATGAQVFIDGLKKGVPPGLIGFFKTCTCGQVSEYSISRYGRDAHRQRAQPDCPVHGDIEFFMLESGSDSEDAIGTTSEQEALTWIKGNAVATREVKDVRDDAYAPLDVGEIRLLHFFPFRLGRKGNIDVPMATITHKLDHVPKFSAISYCWGSNNRDRFMPMLTQDILKITPHLEQIIQNLVYSGTTKVWIDQICIDQGNLEEKAIQVAQMLQIYKAADEVLIHLGHLSAPNKVARFVKHIAPRCREQGLVSTNFTSTLNQQDLSCWAAFREARSSSWFSRTWIVQEMSVNPRTSVLLGQERVSWDDFLAADAISDERFFSQHQGGYASVKLFEILHSTRFLDSSEARDKIYAFMGLFDQTSIGKWLPRPNYRRKVEDIYTSFAVAYALQGYLPPMLPIAGTSQTSRKYQTLMPSWVPDWSFGNVLLKPLRQNREFEHEEKIFSSGKRFKASVQLRTIPLESNVSKGMRELGPSLENHKLDIGDFSNPGQQQDRGQKMMDDILLPLLHHVRAGENGNRASITVKTALFDEIQGLTKLHLFEESLRTQIEGEELQAPSEALPELNKEAMELVSAHIDANDTTSRLARTMIADTWKEKDVYNLGLIHHQWLQALQDVKDRTLSGTPENFSHIWRYGGRIRQTLQNRVFGITKGGRMGIFPSTTRKGDCIGVVAGFDLPFIFSMNGDGFSIVGEAYVEGVVYDEFEETEEAKFEELLIL